MLNLVPGYDELLQVKEYGNKKKSKDVIKVEKDERNPFSSLNYLQPYLKNCNNINIDNKVRNYNTRNVVLLFFHINYESDNVGSDGLGPERWWPYNQRECFSYVINQYEKCKVIGGGHRQHGRHSFP